MESRKRQAKSAQSSSKKPKTDTNITQKADISIFDQNDCGTVSVEGFLASLNVYILPAGIEKTRLDIFKCQIVKNGGKVHDKFDIHNLSHLIVDDKMDVFRMLKLLEVDDFPAIPVVKSQWLSLCLRNKKLVPLEEFMLQNVSSISVVNKVTVNEQVKPKIAEVDKVLHTYSNQKVVRDSDSESSDDDKSCSKTDESTEITGKSSYVAQKQFSNEKWLCAQSSKNVSPNFNKSITDKLEEMVKNYESTNDKWRAFGYQKAIQVLRRHPKEITSWEEAKCLPNVGRRLADKIWEIAQSGELRKLKEFEANDDVRTIKLFTNVWGAGPHTAQVWYQQGLRTISDLKEKANLTRQQEIGVRLYDDLLDRMPREEAGEIETIVRETAERIQDGIIAQACGSYRRGQSTCGDVDVLITHPDGRSHKGIFHPLLTELKNSGFLTDDLVFSEDTGNQKKYLGVCKLPGEGRKHRRLDIIVVPYNEYGCALMYFTGSAHFNRSLRHLCKKQNMSLNEHALKTGVVRKGSEKIFEGTVIPTPTEESVFKALNIPFRPPDERDH